MICVYLIIKQTVTDNTDHDSTQLLQLSSKLLSLMSPSEEKEVSQYVQVETSQHKDSQQGY